MFALILTSEKGGATLDQVKIGKFIASLRKEKGYTQRQLADILDISDKTISKWENGNGLPDISLMMPLCEALGITVNELLSGERIRDENYKSKADGNLINILKSQYRQMLCISILSIVSTIFIIGLGGYLSLHVTAMQSMWLGNAQIQFDGGSFMAETFIFLGFAIFFGIIQLILSKKSRHKIVTFIPIAITIMGLLFCLATYLGAFGTSSPSVIAENQYFAMFLCIPIGGAFVGCLAGMLFAKMLEKHKPVG